MSEADSSEQIPVEDVRVSNHDRRPSAVRKTPRANMPVPAVNRQAAEPEIRASSIDVSDPAAGGGRGFTYEWERRDAVLSRQIAEVAAGAVASHVHDQVVPALTWTIDHNLGFIPSVICVDGSGRQVIPEVIHPSINRTVIVHGKPFAGTAYLRV